MLNAKVITGWRLSLTVLLIILIHMTINQTIFTDNLTIHANTRRLNGENICARLLQDLQEHTQVTAQVAHKHQQLILSPSSNVTSPSWRCLWGRETRTSLGKLVLSRLLSQQAAERDSPDLNLRTFQFTGLLVGRRDSAGRRDEGRWKLWTAGSFSSSSNEPNRKRAWYYLIRVM